ncbi:MAG: hypothetical protein K6U03_10980 [Firmicutes bacterium]|nr:hypothetical protein [Bacillota bacterium]
MVETHVRQDTAGGGEYLRLHPENPRYFLFRGRPRVLITAGEHYGSVINLDFDYLTYLDTLRSWGFNSTRVFARFTGMSDERLLARQEALVRRIAAALRDADTVYFIALWITA